MKKHFLACLLAIGTSFAAHASITTGSISCSGDLSIGDSDTLTTMQCVGDLSLANVVMTNPVAIVLGATGELTMDGVRLDAPSVSLYANSEAFSFGDDARTGPVALSLRIPLRRDSGVSSIRHPATTTDLPEIAIPLNAGSGASGSISLGRTPPSTQAGVPSQNPSVALGDHRSVLIPDDGTQPPTGGALQLVSDPGLVTTSKFSSGLKAAPTLSVPEPSAWVLLCAGLALIARRRRWMNVRG